MGQHFSISDIGLRLIKTYEGYRPVDRTLVSGQRVVGYGHRVRDDEAIILNKQEALTVLKSDLAPFEDMVNENVHAALTQSQFDALCSLAFNIGPKAFLTSDVLRALNNGRFLDAANGFDVWRKSEIDGQIYVVDALVRRRTAEKNLFLRPTHKVVSAPRIDIPPVKDTQIEDLVTSDGLPVFTVNESMGVVTDAPFTRRFRPSRREEDKVESVLSLSEIHETEAADSPESAILDLIDMESIPAGDLISPDPDTESAFESLSNINEDKALEAQVMNPSPIAEAAAQVSERLDALIDDVQDKEVASDLLNVLETEPEPEISTSSFSAAEPQNTEAEIVKNIVTFPSTTKPLGGSEDAADDVLELFEDDLIIPGQTENETPAQADSARKYIQRSSKNLAGKKLRSDEGPYAIMIIAGLTLMGVLIALILNGATDVLGENGQFIAYSGTMIGLMVFLGALFYFFREIMRGRKKKINLKGK